MTIYGLGGCGKSALAIEFAYRALSTHARLVLWVPAISQESFELAYREIGVRLRIPGITDDNLDVKKLVQEFLSSEHVDSWLMIVDNADDYEVLQGNANSNSKPARLSNYLPRSDRGAILFTTRSRKVAGALTQSSVLELTDMDNAEARLLLTRRITKQALLDDETAVDELLNILTCLPLAIVQAAAFINNNDVSVPTYISMFQNTSANTELFSERFEDPSRYEELDNTIAKTWHISFDQIRRQDPLAAEYLSFMACIDRVNIPQSLLPPGASLVQQTKALGTLTGYAFITERLKMVQESYGGRFFDMHRLVHMATVCWLDIHDKRAAWVDTAVARLEELVPYGGYENKEVRTTCLPHAIYVAGSCTIVGKTASVSLLDRVGRYQARLGQYLAAETTHQQVLSVRKKMLGFEHPDTLTSMNYVARALSRQGKYVEAEEMDRETLRLSKKALGEEHPLTLTSMNYVARALSRQGKYVEAEELHRKTLALDKKVSGDEHPHTLTSMGNVAQALSYQGKYAEAEEMDRETLRLCKKVLGEEHPDTLTSMNNVALALNNQGKHTKAEEMHRKTLKLSKKVLGEEHPHTLTSMNNVALALSKQGKHTKAEEMHRKTLELSKKVLGEEHPNTLLSINNVAVALGEQGEYAEAEKMHCETLKLRKRVLGEKHPDTLASVYCLAHVLASQLRYDDSCSLFEQACAAFNTVLGEDHPKTRACHQHYREMLESQEQSRASIRSGRQESSANERANKRQRLG